MEPWLRLAFMAVGFSVINNFIIAKILREGLETYETIVYALPFTIAFGLGLIIANGNKMRPIKPLHIGLLALSTLVGGITLYCYRTSVKLSPNAGYVGAILAMNIIPVTLLSMTYFSNNCTPIKFLGVCVVAAGGFLIAS
jgi:uncharacterized membrane protein